MNILQTYKSLSKIHPALPDLTRLYEQGRMDRRDFLRTATCLGLSASSAYALVGWKGISPALSHQHEMQSGGTLRIVMNIKEITHPAIFDWSEKGNAARLVIEPLVKLGPDNIARPHLLESWQASEDLTQWTLRLRPNILWSNGDTFNADDVIFNFEHWLDPATGSSNISRFSAMTQIVDGQTSMIPGAIEKIDDLTVRLNLRIPDLAIPESLADYPALIVHRRFLEEGGNFITNPVGTGPFELVRFEVGNQAVYRRRQTPYWRGPVPLDEVIYTDLGDEQTAWLSALLSGQVDMLWRLDIDNYETITRNMPPNIKLYQTATAQTGVARMHIQADPFQNKLLRQAILAAIDHEPLLNLGYYGLGLIGENHHVSPVHPEYAELPPLKQDYEKARYLLGAAGYPDGLSLNLDCVAQPKWEPNTALLISEQLKPIGVDVSVNILPGATYWDRWKEAPFGLTAWNHRPLGVQLLNLGYRTEVPWNETGYGNLAFDVLLDQAMGIIDPEERRRYVRPLQKMLQEDAIMVLPFWRSVITASSDRVQGFEIHPAEEIDLRNVWLK